MQIVVQEKPIALRSSYNISTPNGALTAVKAWMPIPPKLTVNTPDGALIAEIKGPLFAFLKPAYTITFPDARSFVFKCEKIIKATYTCISATDTYTLYTHRSLNFSIYKGEEQVAAFTRNRLSIGSGHTYTINANSDVDIPLIVSMVLTFNTLTADKEKKTIGVGIGHIGPIDKDQNTSWQPS